MCFYVHISTGSSTISFVAMLVLTVTIFCIHFYSRIENDDWSAAQLLSEIHCIRDDDVRVLFIDGGSLSTSELNCIGPYCHMFRRVVLNSFLFFNFLCCTSSTIVYTNNRSSIETIALNCLVLRKSRFIVRILATDRHTNRWTCPTHSRSICRERRLNNS